MVSAHRLARETHPGSFGDPPHVYRDEFLTREECEARLGRLFDLECNHGFRRNWIEERRRDGWVRVTPVYGKSGQVLEALPS